MREMNALASGKKRSLERQVLRPLVLVLALTGIATGVASGPAAGRRLASSAFRCTYSPADHTLTGRVLRSGLTLEIRRQGNLLANACAGGTATVHNTDRIIIESRHGIRDISPFIDLSGGPFAPGATDEGDGTSEIEIDVRLPNDVLSSLFVDGTGKRDRIRFGGTRRQLGINLNPPEARPDADVILHRGELAIFSGSGADVINAHGGPGFRHPYPASTTFAGNGPDLLRGSGASDDFVAGDGRDKLFAGAGGDFITVRNGQRDRVECGAGRDFGSADDRDVLHHCEDVKRHTGRHSRIAQRLKQRLRVTHARHLTAHEAAAATLFTAHRHFRH